MNTIGELFEQHQRGALDEAGAATLHRLLISAYFHTGETLKGDELEYTEDLVFELYAENSLEEPFTSQFSDLLQTDAGLAKRYRFQKDLASALHAGNASRLMPVADAQAEDEREEAQLKNVLQEVFKKVHAEKESSPVKEALYGLYNSMKDVWMEFFGSIQFNQPRVRLVMVMASFALVALFAWLLLRQGSGDYMADKKEKPTINTEQPPVTEPGPKAETDELLKEAAKKRINQLVAALFKHASPFDVYTTRGETTAAADSFLLASGKYNLNRPREFDNCIIILNDLLKRKSFTDPDTLAEINFYLGNCYLRRGISTQNDALITKSLRAFSQIGSQSDHYLSSKWYSVFANAQLGRTGESLRLCDTLLKTQFPAQNDVRRMRDSLQILSRIKRMK